MRRGKNIYTVQYALQIILHWGEIQSGCALLGLVLSLGPNQPNHSCRFLLLRKMVRGYHPPVSEVHWQQRQYYRFLYMDWNDIEEIAAQDFRSGNLSLP